MELNRQGLGGKKTERGEIRIFAGRGRLLSELGKGNKASKKRPEV